VASSSQHDPHQQAVYGWEESWPGWNHNHLSLGQCRALIKIVCTHYKVPCPTVTQHDNGTYAWSAPSFNRISMQGGEHMRRGSRNVPTVMHEVAHHVAWHLYGECIQDHGRAFLGVFIECLVKAKVAPQIALEASARAAGLKWTYPKIDRVRPRGA
jgi:hypothetical protein